MARVLRRYGTWGPAARWWQGAAPTWDLVAHDLDADRVVVGEVRAASVRSADDLRRTCERFAARPLPPALQAKEIVRVVFVVGAPKPRPKTGAVHVVTLGDLLR